MKASIFIPTKNAGANFQKVMEAIWTQEERAKEKNSEVIIVDSGSTDETLEIIKKFPQIRLYQIPPEEFGHGRTRNLAVKYATGEFIIFLTQDALPENNFWLSELLKPFENEKVAGTFSRQIPQSDAKITEEFFYHYHFPETGATKLSHLKASSEEITLAHTFFSHASAALRKSLLEKFPLREDLIMCEDQGWSKQVIEAGFETCYVPTSIVRHSHNYNFLETIGRYFDTAHAFKKILGKNFKTRKTGAHYIIDEFKYVWKHRPEKLWSLIPNNIAKVLGTSLGIHTNLLPKKLCRILSMHKYYWEQTF